MQKLSCKFYDRNNCVEDFFAVSNNTILYKSFDERLLSFKKWNGTVEPSELALAGFYYSGCHDITSCFYCGVEVYRWEACDIPINEHLKYSGNCSYAKLVKNLLLRNIKEEHNYITKNHTIGSRRGLEVWLVTVGLHAISIYVLAYFFNN